jgi:hypothetical protein
MDMAEFTAWRQEGLPGAEGQLGAGADGSPTNTPTTIPTAEPTFEPTTVAPTLEPTNGFTHPAEQGGDLMIPFSHGDDDHVPESANNLDQTVIISIKRCI